MQSLTQLSIKSLSDFDFFKLLDDFGDYIDEILELAGLNNQIENGVKYDLGAILKEITDEEFHPQIPQILRMGRNLKLYVHQNRLKPSTKSTPESGGQSQPEPLIGAKNQPKLAVGAHFQSDSLAEPQFQSVKAKIHQKPVVCNKNQTISNVKRPAKNNLLAEKSKKSIDNLGRNTKPPFVSKTEKTQIETKFGQKFEFFSIFLAKSNEKTSNILHLLETTHNWKKRRRK